MREELPPGADDLPARVRAAIRSQLPQGKPEAALVAAKLRLSSRSLQRRLASQGTTYQRLLDEVRSALARAYLEDRRLAGNLTAVAVLLGYSHLPSFLRASRRWQREAAAGRGQPPAGT